MGDSHFVRTAVYYKCGTVSLIHYEIKNLTIARDSGTICNPSIYGREVGDQEEFRVILSYIGSSRPACAT